MSIPKVQTAAVVPKPGAPIEIRKDYPVKQPDELQPGECLVKMHCSGVCHTGMPVRELAVLEPKSTFSRFAREEGRLAYFRCHVRFHLPIGDITVLTLPKSPDRWSRRGRRDRCYWQAHSGLSCKGRRPSWHQMACLLLSSMRICAFLFFILVPYLRPLIQHLSSAVPQGLRTRHEACNISFGGTNRLQFSDCVSAKNSGFSVNGTFSEYVVCVHSVHFVTPVSEATSFPRSLGLTVRNFDSSTINKTTDRLPPDVTPIPEALPSSDAASILCAVSLLLPNSCLI